MSCSSISPNDSSSCKFVSQDKRKSGWNEDICLQYATDATRMNLRSFRKVAGKAVAKLPAMLQFDPGYNFNFILFKKCGKYKFGFNLFEIVRQVIVIECHNELSPGDKKYLVNPVTQDLFSPSEINEFMSAFKNRYSAWHKKFVASSYDTVSGLSGVASQFGLASTALGFLGVPFVIPSATFVIIVNIMGAFLETYKRNYVLIDSLKSGRRELDSKAVLALFNNTVDSGMYWMYGADNKDNLIKQLKGLTDSIMPDLLDKYIGSNKKWDYGFYKKLIEQDKWVATKLPISRHKSAEERGRDLEYYINNHCALRKKARQGWGKLRRMMLMSRPESSKTVEGSVADADVDDSHLSMFQAEDDGSVPEAFSYVSLF